MKNAMLSSSFLRARLARPVFALLLAARVLAHDGPEHEIEELTEKIVKQGATADLLAQRAIEYRVAGKLPEAIKDLERASGMSGASPLIQRELGRAYFAHGKTNEALSTVSRALDGVLQADDRAALLIVRAEIYRARKDHEKALADADAAIEAHPDSVDWHLFRSQLQYALKKKKERIKGLEEGIEQTGSAILSDELADALIEDGQFARASAMIESALQESRWKAGWLLRRARVRLAEKQAEAATADLKAALSELNARMNVSSPDPLLLAERGLAHDLLGNEDEARRDFRRARDKGMTDEWALERLRALTDENGRSRRRR